MSYRPDFTDSNCKILSLLLVIFLGLLIAITPVEAKICPQAKIAVRAGTALIAAARAGSVSRFANTLRRYGDMPGIARFALGRHRKLLPKSRSGEFSRSMTLFIARTFNDFRVQFRARAIEAVDCSGSTVRTRLHFLGARGEETVLWRFRGNKVVDVQISNLWLALQLRQWIAATLRGNGNDINALIKKMKA